MPRRTVKLTDDARDSKPGCVSVNVDRQIRVEMFENGRGGKAAFEFFKGSLAFRRPMKVLAFSKERGDAGYNVGISLNESTIKIRETKEYLNFLNVSGDWPILDGSNMIGVHGDAFRRDDETKE